MKTKKIWVEAKYYSILSEKEYNFLSYKERNIGLTTIVKNETSGLSLFSENFDREYWNEYIEMLNKTWEQMVNQVRGGKR